MAVYWVIHDPNSSGEDYTKVIRYLDFHPGGWDHRAQPAATVRDCRSSGGQGRRTQGRRIFANR